MKVTQNNSSIVIKYDKKKEHTQNTSVLGQLFKIMILGEPEPNNSCQIVIIMKKQELGQQQRLLNCQSINRKQLQSFKKEAKMLEKEEQHKKRLIQLMRNTICQQINSEKQLKEARQNNIKKRQQLKQILTSLKKKRAQNKCQKRILIQNIQQINEKIMKATSGTKKTRETRDSFKVEPIQAHRIEYSPEQEQTSLAQSQQLIDSDSSVMTIESAAIQLTINKESQFSCAEEQEDKRLYKSTKLGGIQEIQKLVSFIQKQEMVRQSIVGILNKMVKKEKEKDKEKRKVKIHRMPQASISNAEQIKTQKKDINLVVSKSEATRVPITKQQAKNNNFHKQMTQILQRALQKRQQKLKHQQKKLSQKHQSRNSKVSLLSSKSISLESSGRLITKNSIVLNQDNQNASDFFTRSFFISRKVSMKPQVNQEYIKSAKVQQKEIENVIQIEKVSNNYNQVIECFMLDQNRRSFSLRILNSKHFNIKIGIRGIAQNFSDLAAKTVRHSAALKQRFFLLDLKNGTIVADGMVVMEQQIKNKKGQIVKVELDFDRKTIEWSIDAQCFSFLKLPKTIIQGGTFVIHSHVQVQDKGDRIQLF